MKKRILIIPALFFILNFAYSCGSSTSTQFQLTLLITGVGTGQISSTATSVDCTSSEATCTHNINSGTALTFTATPDTGYLFLGWYGDTCSTGNTCTLTMNQAQTVRAAFVPLAAFTTLKLDGSDSATTSVLNIWTFKTDGSSVNPLTSITNSNTDATSPVWSPDGETIAFASDQALDGTDAENTNGTSNIWLMNGDGSNIQSLTEITADNAESESPQWSPDGSQILFLSNKALDGSNAANTNNACNVWVMNSDGSGQQALTSLTGSGLSDCSNAIWSPDGSQILYSSARALDGSNAVNANTTLNIWVMNADGSNDTLLTNYEALAADNLLGEWSPNGTRIVYRSAGALDSTDTANSNETFNIWIMDSDGTDKEPLTSLTANAADCFDPTFSPDGTKLAYFSPRKTDGTDAGTSPVNYNVWIINADGTGNAAVTSLTNEDAGFGALFPFWALDGNSLFFISSGALDGSDAQNTNKATNLWQADGDGSNPTPITSYEGAGGILIFL